MSFRLGSDERRMNNQSIKTHTRFVQDVKFAPSGDLFASVGADSAAFLYNGTTGDVVAELKDAHQGSAVSAFFQLIVSLANQISDGSFMGS